MRLHACKAFNKLDAERRRRRWLFAWHVSTGFPFSGVMLVFLLACCSDAIRPTAIRPTFLPACRPHDPGPHTLTGVLYPFIEGWLAVRPLASSRNVKVSVGVGIGGDDGGGGGGRVMVMAS